MFTAVSLPGKLVWTLRPRTQTLGLQKEPKVGITDMLGALGRGGISRARALNVRIDTRQNARTTNKVPGSTSGTCDPHSAFSLLATSPTPILCCAIRRNAARRSIYN